MTLFADVLEETAFDFVDAAGQSSRYVKLPWSLSFAIMGVNALYYDREQDKWMACWFHPGEEVTEAEYESLFDHAKAMKFGDLEIGEEFYSEAAGDSAIYMKIVERKVIVAVEPRIINVVTIKSSIRPGGDLCCFQDDHAVRSRKQLEDA